MVLWVVSVVFAIGFSYADGSLRAWLEKVGGGGSISWFVGMGWGQGVCQCIPLTPLYTPYAVGTVRDIIFYNHRNSP